MVFVNSVVKSDSRLPSGGVKDSGMGREGVKYAMLDMIEPKVLVK